MERLEELYQYKEKFSKELLFAEAKIAVVEEMIADERAKLSEVNIADISNAQESI